MSIFPFTKSSLENILPKDGAANYYGKIFTTTEANFYFQQLLTGIEWKNDESFIYGKHLITKRKVGWYGDKDYDYTYSKITKKALPWTKELLEIKKTQGRAYSFKRPIQFLHQSIL